MFSTTSSFLSIALLAAPAIFGAPPDLAQALDFYNHTNYRQSLEILSAIDPPTAEVEGLMGQNHFMLGDTKRAIEFFEKAAGEEPARAFWWDWLGRAWGRRAEVANPLAALGYAIKARQNFEKAVQLDPNYGEASADLFEFYLEAPTFMGGGLDKAEAVAASIAKRDPAEGYWARALIAEKRKMFASAEQQLTRAMELAPKQVGRVLDLAKFLAKEGRFEESDRRFADAQRLSPGSPKVLYARADTYITTGRNIGMACELLRRYIASGLTPDDPPRADAAKLLQRAEKLMASSRP